MFLPSIYPNSRSPCRNAATRPSTAEDLVPERNPICGIFADCCPHTGKQRAKSRMLSVRQNTCLLLLFAIANLKPVLSQVEVCTIASLDHLVRPGQNIRWYGQPELLGGFKVDHQLELYRLLYGEVSGFGAPQDLVDVHCGT